MQIKGFSLDNHTSVTAPLHGSTQFSGTQKPRRSKLKTQLNKWTARFKRKRKQVVGKNSGQDSGRRKSHRRQKHRRRSYRRRQTQPVNQAQTTPKQKSQKSRRDLRKTKRGAGNHAGELSRLEKSPAAGTPEEKLLEKTEAAG